MSGRGRTRRQTANFSPGATIRRSLVVTRRQKVLQQGQKSPVKKKGPTNRQKQPSPGPEPSTSGLGRIPKRRKLLSSSSESGPEQSPKKKSRTEHSPSVPQFNMPVEFMDIMNQFKDRMLSEFQRTQGNSTSAKPDRRWLTGIESKFKLKFHYHVLQAKTPFDGLCSSEVWEEVPFIPVKGKLKRAQKFWAATDKAGRSLKIIDEGYRIPFLEQPPEAFFKNNRSALEEPVFVKEAILKLLKSRLIERVARPPLVINPLSVATQSSGKKRLILDASPINQFIRKQKFKMEDYSIALQFLEVGQYVYSFDLEAAYNHLDIHPDSVRYLGFSWVFNGRQEWFQYTVLCFGLCTGPYVFTKFLRPLVRRWRAEGIQLILYLDDGLGIGADLDSAKKQARRVSSDLSAAGFCVNDKKSIWEPTKHLIWLGVEIDLNDRFLRTPEVKRQKILAAARGLIARRNATPRQVASLAGKLIDMRLILGDIAVIDTKRLCRHIVSTLGGSQAWDFYHPLSDEVKEEIAAWIRRLLKPEVSRKLSAIQPPTVHIFSDASAVAAAAYIKDSGIKFIRNFDRVAQAKSSCWRELMIVPLALENWCDLLQGKTVTWCTDNLPITFIIRKGSMKAELNELACQIFDICAQYQITLKLSWIPRADNKTADFYSRMIDRDDWEIQPRVFAELDSLFGPHDFDRFADATNTKCTKFNSLNWEKGADGTDALSYNWQGWNNWLVPPPFLLLKTVKHLQACRAEGTLCMAEWPSNPVWPILMPNRLPASFVKDIRTFTPGRTAVVPGKYAQSVFSNGELRNDMIAFRLDCTGAS